MEKIHTFEEALEQLKQGEVLVSSSFGGPITFYEKKGSFILYRNDNFKAYLSLEKFKKDFDEGNFYLFEGKEEEIEIDQHDKYWRQ